MPSTWESSTPAWASASPETRAISPSTSGSSSLPKGVWAQPTMQARVIRSSPDSLSGRWARRRPAIKPAGAGHARSGRSRAPCPHQEVEVASVRRLRDGAAVERLVAAARAPAAAGGRRGAGRSRAGSTSRSTRLSRIDRLDPVAVAHRRQRAADRRFRRHVQHDRAEGGARHPRVGQAHHVGHPRPRQLLRDRQVARLRHPRRVRAGILQDQDVARRHVQIRVVDPRSSDPPGR